ncbi:pyridoxal-phosphate dependent enzyme [Naumannella halotolerans]|uniref:pyridoxal-phosphate dependent enzyme n=1 Tax=Naumannella halotolerans TaxID=993414 RepID=UPI001AAF046F|nr:pyridoxal-phosphate dependent enzyme [Naumannella halotolerans]
MTTIATSITDLIGHTPLLELQKYSTNRGLRARLLAKLEYLNPLGSVKDRAAWSIIRQAEESGALQPGGTIVDVTSGNTGDLPGRDRRPPRLPHEVLPQRQHQPGQDHLAAGLRCRSGDRAQCELRRPGLAS